MHPDTKKSRERRIFDLVYGERSFNDVTQHENPDFLVRHLRDAPVFGVEVTEYYHSETDARMDRIAGYVSHLLEGHDFRHKDDRKTLTVSKINIIRPDETIHAEDVPAIIQEVPQPSEGGRQLAERISQKAIRIRDSTTRISHANLIVRDRSGFLRLIPKSDFYQIYFGPELRTVIASAPFREIFLVTDLQDELVFARLKMLHLLAEAYLFNGAILKHGLAKRISKEVDDTDLFAAYLGSTVSSQVLVHQDALGKEVIFGDSGILIGDDKRVTVRLHSDYPIASDAVAPTLDWEGILGTQFVTMLSEYRESRTFSTEAVFPVCTENT
jgi:hypothetical protein